MTSGLGVEALLSSDGAVSTMLGILGRRRWPAVADLTARPDGRASTSSWESSHIVSRDGTNDGELTDVTSFSSMRRGECATDVEAREDDEQDSF